MPQPLPDSWPARLRRRAGHVLLSLRAFSPYAAAALLLLALGRSPINETLNLLFYDLVMGMRASPSGADSGILVVAIDEEDIRRYGWPIDDALLCRGIDRLLSGGATAVGLDIYRDKGVGPDQECLRQRFRDEPRLVSIFNVAGPIGPVPGTPPGRQAFNDLVLDPDGVVRRDLVHVGGQDEATVALPLRLMEVGLGAHWLRRAVEGGTAPGPWLTSRSSGYDQLDDGGYQQMLVFRQLGSFPKVHLRDLLSADGIAPERIRQRLVLIGSTAPSLRDVFSVPHTRFARGASQLLIPGVEVHAHRLASLLDRRDGIVRHRIGPIPVAARRGLEVLALLLGVAVGEGIRSLRRSVLAVAFLVLLLIGSALLLLLYAGIWIGPSMPVASLAIVSAAGWVRRGATSQLQRMQIERLLGQTTSPAVAQQLWLQREDLLRDGRFEGRQLSVTVLMTDMVGFTSVSERLAPGDLLDWLNKGMASLVPAITQRKGMVNKFTGDGVLAVFGAPLSLGEQADALAAIEAALAIQKDFEVLNARLVAEGAPAMRIRVGVHSGPVLAGSMGSSERLEYAVIGDTVNCASRLESLDKDRHDNICRVLVSSSTRALLPDDLPVAWNSWGSMVVKGRSEPLEIWELRGRLGQAETTTA